MPSPERQREGSPSAQPSQTDSSTLQPQPSAPGPVPPSRLASLSARLPSARRRRTNSSPSRPPPPPSQRHLPSFVSSIGPQSQLHSRVLSQSQSPPPKPNRPPPRRKHANVAGPSSIPDAVLSRYNSDRAGSAAGSSAVGDSEYMGSEDGDRGGKKPVWAVGGVFPKRQGRRRESAARDSAPQRDKVRKQDKKGKKGRWNPERQDSMPATMTDSSAGGSAASTPFEGVVELGDPFDGYGVPVSSNSSRGADEAPGSSDEAPGRPRHSFDLSEGGSTLERPVRREDQEPSNDAQSQMVTEHLEQQSALDRRLSAASTLDERRRREEEAEEERDRHLKGEDRYEGKKEGEDRHGEPTTVDEEEGKPKQWPKDGGEQPAVGGELNQQTDQWDEDFEHTPDGPPVRNWWGTVRFALREPLAEFLGTLVLVVIGIGSNCQSKISQFTMGDNSTVHWSWGFAVMTSLYIAGGISGGHNNPSVTIALAVFRGFPWKMVPRYIFAQILGSFVGALMIYGNYRAAIHDYDPNKLIQATTTSNASATLFVTAPGSPSGTTAQGFGQEILASGILSIAVLSLGDENNAPPGAGLGAIVLGFVVTAIGMSNGWVSGYAINPARDFGPRLALWCVGYGLELWTHNDWWWIVGPICGTLVGALGGCFAYDLCIFTGPGSPVNYSAYELAGSVGLPKMHNMVLHTIRPSTRSATRGDDFSDEEAGLPPTSSIFGRAYAMGLRPAQRHQSKMDELEVTQRWRRGRETVGRQEERNRTRYEESRKRSIEAARRNRAERENELRRAEGEEEMSPQPIESSSAAYPPQNSLEAALHRREAMDSMATVQLSQEPHESQKTAEELSKEERATMRLRGGCLDFESCGCPCECCCIPIPCTIA
ncbi:hypothetical protein JCM1840_005798 [Sporobolomyces johnsonii]